MSGTIVVIQSLYKALIKLNLLCIVVVKVVGYACWSVLNHFHLVQGKKMNVMMIASGDLWAGAEVMLYQLVNVFAKDEEVKLCVVLLNQGRLAEEVKKIGVEVYVVDETQYSFLALCNAVRKLIAAFSPNIIHSHRYKENLLALLAVVRTSNISLVATQHGMPEIAGADVSLIGRLRKTLSFRLLSQGFDRTVFVSEEMRQILLGSYGFSQKNVTVIHNGISIPKSFSHRAGQRIVIGTAGRLCPVKDFTLLVEIANLVIKRCDTVDFLIAGDGPQYKMLEEKISSYGLEQRFKLLGNQDDMDAFYRSLDVYVNSSVHEGIPMSVLEAMSYGLPVIVPEVGGFPEIVKDGEQGYLIKGRQKDDYSDRLLELIFDKKLRLKMAVSARQQVVAHFSREAMARAYFDAYSAIWRD